MVKYALAVDLGATNLRVALGNDQGKILIKLKEKTIHAGNKDAIARQILRMICLILQSKKPIAGVGIAAVGPLDFKRKAIVHTPNIPVPVIPLTPLKKTKKPTYLLNDASAAVLGEKYYGLGKNHENIVYITISSGIGGGAIVDNHFLWGEDGNAAEIGHMIVDSTYNLPCSCTKGKGHWQSYASGNTIAPFCKIWLQEKGISKIPFELTTETILTAAEQGNSIAQKFVDELGTISARALSNIIVAYSPSLITLGGSVVLYHPDLFFRSIKGKIDPFLKIPTMEVTSLGENIGLLGALAAVFHKQGVKI